MKIKIKISNFLQYICFDHVPVDNIHRDGFCYDDPKNTKVAREKKPVSLPKCDFIGVSIFRFRSKD